LEQSTRQYGLIDTDILIDASRGIAQAGEFLDEVASHSSITISIISAMELLIGCRNTKQLLDVKQTLDLFTILPTTESISLNARALIETYTLSHGLLIPDALLAATALENNFALYTRNIRHYKMILNLQIVQPY
jgi:predicted nucleic acid-binding protein